MTRPDVAAAVSTASDGVHLALEVTPAAAEGGFPTGYNAWRQRIGIRVTAPPRDGKANDDVCRTIATFFGLGPHDVSITQGATSTRKTVRLRGVAEADVLARLEAAL